MPEIVPGEVVDLRDLECRVECVLDVSDRLAGVPTDRVREHERTIRDTLTVKRLQRCQHRRVQRHRVGPAALRARNAENAIQEILTLAKTRPS